MTFDGEIGVPQDAYGYVYMNYYKSTDKWYIGRHKSRKFDWNYYGSGDMVTYLMEDGKIKPEDVCTMVLSWANSEDDLNKKEYYWIKFFDAVVDKNFYNLIDGGGYEMDSNPTLVPVICVELNKRFMTISHAAQWCNRSKSALIHALKGDSKSCAGYHWVFEDREKYEKIRKVRSKCYFGEDRGFRKGSKHSEKSKNILREHSIGRKHSKESIEKMRESQRKRFDENPVSEETRRKLSKALSGEKNPMYGKPSGNKGGWHQPEEAKEAIRKARLGVKLSDVVKHNMSEAQKLRYKKDPIKPNVIEALRKANLGKTLSKEHKEKLRQANLGKHLSEEHKEKLRQTHLGHEPYKFVEVYCPELGMRFHTLKEATKYVGLKDCRGIRDCLSPNGRAKHAGRVEIDGKLVKLSWVKVGDNYEQH